ncbi:AAA domain-containing protein [Maricaulis sp.]|uniref:AAA domain-containing protein n=1 Tax=Maricaulis sp. TaxID=1486257 RepID=UPI003A951AD5
MRFPDTHGHNWLAFETSGTWWQDAWLEIEMDRLPPTFQQTLMQRDLKTAVLGWPIFVVPSDDGVQSIPALIVLAEWRVVGEVLRLEVGQSIPTLNPDWLREVRRRTTWSESELSEVLFPAGEDADLGAVGVRIRRAVATIVEAPLKPGTLDPHLRLVGESFQNVAALFLPDERSFTMGAARDLQAIKDWDVGRQEQSVLTTLLQSKENYLPSPINLIATKGLTDRQTDACDRALSERLTVVQGPPGTGKSEIITSMVVSAVLAGKSVLFSSKNHQALDEVQARLRGVFGDAPVVTRARDRGGEADVSFLDALRLLAASDTKEIGPEAAESFASEASAESFQDRHDREQRRDWIQLNLRMSQAVERLEGFPAAPEREGKSSWLSRLITRVLRALGLRSRESVIGIAKQELVDEVETLRSELAVFSDGEPNIVDRDREEEWFGKVRQYARAICAPTESARQRISDRLAQLKHGGESAVANLSRADADDVLKHRPVWVVSTLAAPKRFPLMAGLFDLVIIDEASQCDIASALPLFARGQRGVIVGDPLQLEFIRSVSRDVDHALMDHAGLPKAGRWRYSQNVCSLFDFADKNPRADRHFLADQFRSHPAIVDYLNSSFYSGKQLDGRRSGEEFKPPRSYKAGLDWADVRGRCRHDGGGNVNREEVQEIVAIVRKICDDQNFEGTIGVISPFNSQVGAIQSALADGIEKSHRERLGIRVATVDKFQGGEADVILFSLTVTASAQRSALTFLKREYRRFNVAVSRARALCIVVGDLQFAQHSDIGHIKQLARRATQPWSPPRPPFDSIPERKLYQAMLRRGLEPFAQYPVGTRYLDFAIDPEGRKIDVEVDGKRWHTDETGARKSSDLFRDRELRARGWRIVRLWVHEVYNDMEACLDRIDRELND